MTEATGVFLIIFLLNILITKYGLKFLFGRKFDVIDVIICAIGASIATYNIIH